MPDACRNDSALVRISRLNAGAYCKAHEEEDARIWGTANHRTCDKAAKHGCSRCGNDRLGLTIRVKAKGSGLSREHEYRQGHQHRTGYAQLGNHCDRPAGCTRTAETYPEPARIDHRLQALDVPVHAFLA